MAWCQSTYSFSMPIFEPTPAMPTQNAVGMAQSISTGNDTDAGF
jgi:hypothetical protein